ncbi:hypothetical protein FRC17_006144 [Serendipita sp. 399]|nr:hypothetical protein FRC17_006144 [Serendipita sp. 399]
MAQRFAQFVSSVDAHLPDGLSHVIKTWFDTTGAVALLQVVDDVWLTIRDMCLSLAFDGVIPPGLLLDGMVYPQWQWALRHRDYDQYHLWPKLQRTLNLVSILIICSTEHIDSSDPRLGTYLEACRARIVHPSHIKPLMDGIVTLAVLKHSMDSNSAIQLKLKTFLDELLNDPFVRRSLLSRISLLRNSFDKALECHPECRKGLICDFRLCLGCQATKDLNPDSLTSTQWTSVLDEIDIWTFEKMSLDLTLVQQLLRLRLTETVEDGLFGHFQYKVTLDEFASALLNHPLTASTTALFHELLKEANPALVTKIVLKGLGKLHETFRGSVLSNLDDLSTSLRSIKEILRLVVTFGRLQKTSEEDWPVNERDSFLGIWADQMASLRTAIQSQGGHSAKTHGICDAISLMVRVMHFVLEIIGSSLGPKAVEIVILLIDIAIVRVLLEVMWFISDGPEQLVGGGVVYDEITYQLLLDTICIIYDDCSKDTKSQLVKALSERFPITSIPSVLPLRSRIRLDSILPFVPHDKLGAGLARAQRVGNHYEFTSQLRGRPWEWISSIESREEATSYNTRVRNNAVMPLELFGTTSRGEGIAPTTESSLPEDILLFHDSIASEDLLTRAWRESRAAWDLKNLEGLERVGTSGYSPGVSRPSMYTASNSGMTSPIVPYPRGQQPSAAPTVETLVAEPMDVEPNRGLKRKVRLDEEGDEDEVMAVSEPSKGNKPSKGKEKSKR